MEIKMQSFNNHNAISCSSAKQGGSMPSYWSAINTQVNLDRTPEGYFSSGLIREDEIVK